MPERERWIGVGGRWIEVGGLAYQESARGRNVARVLGSIQQIRQNLAVRQAHLNQAEAAFDKGDKDAFWQLLSAIEPIPSALLTELHYQLAVLHHAEGRLSAEQKEAK